MYSNTSNTDTEKDTEAHTHTQTHTCMHMQKKPIPSQVISDNVNISRKLGVVLVFSLCCRLCVCRVQPAVQPKPVQPGVNPAVPHLRSAPLWPVSSWQWLADLISAALNVASVAPLTTLLMSSFVALHLSTPTVAAAEIRRANSVCPVNCSRH